MSLNDDWIGEIEAMAFRYAPGWEVTAKYQREECTFLEMKEKSWGRVVTLRFTNESLEDDFFEDETAIFRDQGEAWLRAFFKEQLPNIDDRSERIIRSGETRGRIVKA